MFLPLLRRSTNEPELQKKYMYLQMSFDMNDGYVKKNTLTADFNLFSGAIQGDTHRFELIEWFIKVRNLL